MLEKTKGEAAEPEEMTSSRTKDPKQGLLTCRFSFELGKVEISGKFVLVIQFLVFQICELVWSQKKLEVSGWTKDYVSVLFLAVLFSRVRSQRYQ